MSVAPDDNACRIVDPGLALTYSSATQPQTLCIVDYRLEREIGMSVAPDDGAWRGRVFDPGLVLHRDTGSSRDCSAAWAADIVQRVARQGTAASDAASLAHIEGVSLDMPNL